jgi:uncharacterized protein (DUF779 family)
LCIFFDQTSSKVLHYLALSSKRATRAIAEEKYQIRSQQRLLRYARFLKQILNVQRERHILIPHLPNGNCHGRSQYFIPSSSVILSETTFKLGLCHGYDIGYKSDTQMEFYSCYFQMGIPDGLEVEYENGNNAMIVYWNRGRIVAKDRRSRRQDILVPDINNVYRASNSDQVQYLRLE